MVRDPSRPEPNMVLQMRDVIQRDGRSLNQLAKDSGVDAGRLSRFLRGERDINFGAAARLCDVLGITFTLPAALAGEPAPALPRSARPARKPRPRK
jgi:transcriptional regulator with XRE-family HTH domain